jgi:hypothetical protein
MNNGSIAEVFAQGFGLGGGLYDQNARIGHHFSIDYCTKLSNKSTKIAGKSGEMCHKVGEKD